MSTSQLIHAPVHLLGDPDENFYQLGLKDQKGYFFVKKHLLALAQRFKVRVGNNCPFHRYKSWLTSYAEGLKEPVNHLFETLNLIELLGTNQTAPFKSPFSQSSLFYRSADSVFHTTILNSPLLESYQQSERELTFQFKNMAKVWSLGTQSLCLPAFNGFNEYGISYAIHTKSHTQLYSEGTHIFEIMAHVMFEADTLEAALRIIRSYQTRVKWGIHLIKDHHILEIDIFKNEIEVKEYELAKNQFYYFNNKDISRPLGRPAGHCFFDKKREDNFIHSLAKIKKKDLKAQDILKALTTPVNIDEQPFTLSTITPSSTQVSCLNLTEHIFYLLPGPCPKLYHHQLLSRENLFEFSSVTYKDQKFRGKKIEPRKMRGYWHLSQAQYHIDKNNLPQSFFHIQMAKTLFKNFTEYHFAQFYFLVLKSLHISCKKELSLTLIEWKKLKNHLNEVLQDHAFLYISRLEKILDFSPSVKKDYIKDPKLQYIFLKEKEMSKTLLHIKQKKHIPRIGENNILYLY